MEGFTYIKKSQLKHEEFATIGGQECHFINDIKTLTTADLLRIKMTTWTALLKK